MLGRADKVLAVVCWVVAGLLVLMLFIGPEVVAEDKAEPTKQEASGASPYASGGGSTSSVDGKQAFTSSCGSCHTLQSAGTTGTVGPPLDDIGLSAADIEAIVKSGRGAMPAFEGELSADEIAAVAAFVAG